MRFTTGLALAGLLLAVPGSASAQGATDSLVKAPGVAVAPGIRAPVETAVKPSAPPEKPAPAAR